MWLAVEENGKEFIYEGKPTRAEYALTGVWINEDNECAIEVPEGTIERLLNYPLTWDDEAEEIKEYK